MSDEEINDEEGSFRDKVSTIDDDGKRIWVFPKKPGGWFYDKRKIVSYLLLVLLFVGPYIKINGNPLFMMNILERKFVIFGNIFWPQEMYLFALAMIIFVLFIVLFTVIFGRLFCGWVCPQTIFMEMVFRRIEYWIDGDWKAQQRLAKSPWTAEKIRKTVLKQTIFWLIAFVVANTFLMYIIGYEALFAIITDNPFHHIGGLAAIIVFTTIFYLVFSRLREQVCTTICPYGRLQSVMLDRRSLVVAYDHVRGEGSAGRGKFKKTENRAEIGKGDCIDCMQCVHVCPTGIDIRNGTQLECVNCTACIDACDTVMDKVGFDRGLIRLDSIEGIENQTRFSFTPRIKGYIAVLTVMVGIMVALLVNRSEFDATIYRSTGSSFNRIGNGAISNIFDITVLNKTNRDIPLEIRLMDDFGELQLIGKEVVLKSESNAKTKFLVTLQSDEFSSRSTEIHIGLFDKETGELIQEEDVNFMTPSL